MDQERKMKMAYQKKEIMGQDENGPSDREMVGEEGGPSKESEDGLSDPETMHRSNGAEGQDV